MNPIIYMTVPTVKKLYLAKLFRKLPMFLFAMNMPIKLRPAMKHLNGISISAYRAILIFIEKTSLPIIVTKYFPKVNLKSELQLAQFPGLHTISQRIGFWI